MGPGDHRAAAAAARGAADAAASGAAGGSGESHWVRWHRAYEDAGSRLSLRLRLVQAMVGDVLDGVVGSRPPIQIVSMCAGQGRDVIDVVSTHPRGAETRALLVERDPVLAAFARERAAAAGVGDRIRVVEADAGQCRSYEGEVPANLVLVCGVFGNISDADITRTIRALPGLCGEGAEVIWTRHRRPPDATSAIRADFAASGFEEVAFESPDGYVLSVGRHRLLRAPASFDPDSRLFAFVGDGSLPA